MGTNDGGEELVADAEMLAGLDGVTPVAAAQLTDAGVTASDVTEKRVTYTDLVEAGIEQGVATALRREHSLSWSSTLGDGLDERAESIAQLFALVGEFVLDAGRDFGVALARDQSGVDQVVQSRRQRRRARARQVVLDGAEPHRPVIGHDADDVHHVLPAEKIHHVREQTVTRRLLQGTLHLRHRFGS